MIPDTLALAHDSYLRGLALGASLGLLLGMFAALVLLAFLRAASEEPPAIPTSTNPSVKRGLFVHDDGTARVLPFPPKPRGAA